MSEKDWEQQLRNRSYEPPRYGFEQRILAHARTTGQLKSPWLRAILGELMIPRMQLVYALVLTLGIALGFSAPPATTIAPSYLGYDGAAL
jgi:hypothetical protein